jgi:predicted secreted protein
MAEGVAHVTKGPDGRWRATLAGTTVRGTVARSRQAALDAARHAAFRAEISALVVHAADGAILGREDVAAPITTDHKVSKPAT